MLYLNCVSLEHPFVGLHVLGVNGSLWSIAYEFRCYALLLLIGTVGIARSRRLMVTMTTGLLVWAAWCGNSVQSSQWEFILGAENMNARLFSLFASGCVFYLFKDRIRYTKLGAGGSAVGLCALLSFDHLSTVALAVFGGYLIFWFALVFRPLSISRKTNKTDLSYGVYLYGWPVTSAIIWCCNSQINRWVLCAASLVATGGLAWVSWTFIERPALSLKAHLADGNKAFTAPVEAGMVP
jgi:peptidoglycan/LPS O-acetylase OafA/YrhL